MDEEGEMPNGDPNTLIFWLVQTLREAREAGGPEGERIQRRKVSEYLDMDTSTLNDFETGRTGWPRQPEDRVEAYAALTGRPAVDLWQTAVRSWADFLKSPPRSRRRKK
jgi:hypothetical protein